MNGKSASLSTRSSAQNSDDLDTCSSSDPSFSNDVWSWEGDSMRISSQTKMLETEPSTNKSMKPITFE
jgi:hypothetical protein